MFDFDAGKLLIIGALALVVIGPKDLPRVLRQVGQWTGRMRRMANDFRGQFMDAMREADFESIKKEVDAAAQAAHIEHDFDPVGDVNREVRSALEDKPEAAHETAVMRPLDGPADPASAAHPPSNHGVANESAPLPHADAATGDRGAEGPLAAATARVPAADELMKVATPAPVAREILLPAPLSSQAAARSRLRMPHAFRPSRGDALAIIAARRTDRASQAASDLRRRPFPADHGESGPRA